MRLVPNSNSNYKANKTTFRFMELPCEIRCIIYKFLLLETHSELSFFTTTKEKTLIRGRISKFQAMRTSHNNNSWLRIPLPKGESQLDPTLLRVSRGVHNEALPILYGQSFYFEHPPALSAFLLSIGATNRSLLRKIVIRGWMEKECTSWTQSLGMALTMLTTVTNLQTLRFDRRVKSFQDDGALPSVTFVVDYRVYQAHAFMHDIAFLVQSINATKGRGTAEKIITFSDLNFGSREQIIQGDQSMKDRKEAFFKIVKLH
jgi:hypothetical protein